MNPDDRVLSWDVIAVGHLSCNEFWGETPPGDVREPLCTCTLIQTDKLKLLVDPCHKEKESTAFDLERRSGLGIKDINAVFITHAHGDHHWGLKHFPKARWLAAPPTVDLLEQRGEYDHPFEAVEKDIGGCVKIVSAPGHTMDLHALRFQCEGSRIVIASDAVMNRDYWKDRRGFFKSVDFDLARESIEALTRLADIIVPGHDNYFVIPR